MHVKCVIGQGGRNQVLWDIVHVKCAIDQEGRNQILWDIVHVKATFSVHCVSF